MDQPRKQKRKVDNTKKTCIFCEGDHLSDDCYKYMVLDSRIKSSNPSSKDKGKSDKDLLNLTVHSEGSELVHDDAEKDIMDMQIPDNEKPITVCAKTKVYNPDNRELVEESLAKKQQPQLSKETKCSIIKFSPETSIVLTHRHTLVTMETENGGVTKRVKALKGLMENPPSMKNPLAKEKDPQERKSKPEIIIGMENLGYFHPGIDHITENTCIELEYLGITDLDDKNEDQLAYDEFKSKVQRNSIIQL
uniref:Gag-pol polyprotein n=1 Tax=Syphacia muris TaxID=451379 RepID=A0A0N5B1J9_9BILA